MDDKSRRNFDEQPFMNDRMNDRNFDHSSKRFGNDRDSRAQRLQDGTYEGSDRSQKFNDDQSYWQSEFNEFGRMPSSNTNDSRRSFADRNRSNEFSQNQGFQGNDVSYGRENYGTRGSNREPERYDRSSMFSSNQPGNITEGVKNFFGKGPKGYKRSDERIREEISEALYRHSAIDASEIEIDVKDGVVNLQGSVEGRRMKRLVEDVIEDVHGVSDVHNNLRLIPIGGLTNLSAAGSASSKESASSKKGSIQ